MKVIREKDLNTFVINCMKLRDKYTSEPPEFIKRLDPAQQENEINRLAIELEIDIAAMNDVIVEVTKENLDLLYFEAIVEKHKNYCVSKKYFYEEESK